jgi:hypothetical protein
MGGQEEAKMASGGEGKMELFDKLLMALEDAKRVIRDEIADKVRPTIAYRVCDSRQGPLPVWLGTLSAASYATSYATRCLHDKVRTPGPAPACTRTRQALAQRQCVL